jgi:PAS domain S-box-containing protein
MDSMLEGCQVLGRDWTIRYLNASSAVHNRRPNEELLGRNYLEVWPGIESTPVFAAIRRSLEERVALRLENQFVFPDGTSGWFDLRFEPVPEGVLILSVDISAGKRTEQRERHLASVLQSIRRVNQLIVREKNPQVLLQLATQALVESRSYRSVWAALCDETGAVTCLAHTGWGGLFADFQARLLSGWRPGCWDEARRARGQAADPGALHPCCDCPLRGPEDPSASAIVRLQHAGRDMGRLGVYRAPGEAIDVDECGLLEEVAADLGFALHAIESERRRSYYEQIVTSSRDGMALINRDFVYLEANPAYLRLVGRSEPDLRGHTVADVIGLERFNETVRGRLERGFAGETEEFESTWPSAGGTPRALLVQYSPSPLPTASSAPCR